MTSSGTFGANRHWGPLCQKIRACHLKLVDRITCRQGPDFAGHECRYLGTYSRLEFQPAASFPNLDHLIAATVREPAVRCHGSTATVRAQVVATASLTAAVFANRLRETCPYSTSASAGLVISSSARGAYGFLMGQHSTIVLDRCTERSTSCDRSKRLSLAQEAATALGAHSDDAI